MSGSLERLRERVDVSGGGGGHGEGEGESGVSGRGWCGDAGEATRETRNGSCRGRWEGHFARGDDTSGGGVRGACGRGGPAGGARATRRARAWVSAGKRALAEVRTRRRESVHATFARTTARRGRDAPARRGRGRTRDKVWRDGRGCLDDTEVRSAGRGGRGALQGTHGDARGRAG